MSFKIKYNIACVFSVTPLHVFSITFEKKYEILTQEKLLYQRRRYIVIYMVYILHICLFVKLINNCESATQLIIVKEQFVKSLIYIITAIIFHLLLLYRKM